MRRIFALFSSFALLTAGACGPSTQAVDGGPAPSPASTPAAASTGTYVMTVQGQTFATERFTRTASSVEADLNLSQGPRVRYTATLAPDASVTRLDLRVFPPESTDTVPAQRGTLVVRGDSAYLESVTGTAAPQTATVAAPRGAVVVVNPSPTAFEQIARRARAIGGQTVQVPVLVLAGGGQTATATVTFGGDGVATIEVANVRIDLRLDETGAIVGGGVPSQGLTLSRAP